MLKQWDKAHHIDDLVPNNPEPYNDGDNTMSPKLLSLLEQRRERADQYLDPRLITRLGDYLLFTCGRNECYNWYINDTTGKLLARSNDPYFREQTARVMGEARLLKLIQNEKGSIL